MPGFDCGYRSRDDEGCWRVLRRIGFTLQGNCVTELITGSSNKEMVVCSYDRGMIASAGKGCSGKFDNSNPHCCLLTLRCGHSIVLRSIHSSSNSKFHTKYLARLLIQAIFSYCKIFI